MTVIHGCIRIGVNLAVVQATGNQNQVHGFAFVQCNVIVDFNGVVHLIDFLIDGDEQIPGDFGNDIITIRIRSDCCCFFTAHFVSYGVTIALFLVQGKAVVASGCNRSGMVCYRTGTAALEGNLVPSGRRWRRSGFCFGHGEDDFARDVLAGNRVGIFALAEAGVIVTTNGYVDRVSIIIVFMECSRVIVHIPSCGITCHIGTQNYVKYHSCFLYLDYHSSYDISDGVSSVAVIFDSYALATHCGAIEGVIIKFILGFKGVIQARFRQWLT